MCLSSCPTYELTKLERSSPRGRIKLIRSAAEGIIPVSKTFSYEMNFCLDCRACETACPAGVQYGKMVEAARVETENNGYSSFLKSFFLKKVIPYKNRLKFAAAFLRFYQKSGLQKMIRSSGVLKYLFPKLSDIEELAPEIKGEFSDSLILEFNPPAGKQKFKLAFSYGCLMNIFFSDVNRDTVELLNKIGAEVISPVNQTCCGSLNAHNGDIKTAKILAEKNIKEFGRYEYDYLISNSAGCGAFMKEYGELFKEDADLAAEAEEFALKVKDISEFLSQIQLPQLKNKYDQSVTYHDACHLVHTQKVFSQPRELISKVQGINFIPLEESTKCCGSAGIYNLVHFNTSMELLKMKTDKIKETGAEIVLTGNPGCMLQIGYGLKRHSINSRVEHTATFFNKLL
jgi:glycolate oxidase iron-sulfur subunit